MKHSFWAKAYYQSQRDKGKSHHTAVRALAYKWIRIIHRLWIDRCRYDENHYIQVLRQKGSHLVPRIDSLIQDQLQKLQPA